MPLIGLNKGLQTLCSQAFGKKDYTLVGIYFQRGLSITCLWLAVATICYMLSYHVLSHIGIEEEMALIASRFLRIFIVQSWFYIIFDTLKNYLSACRIFNPPMVI